MTKRTNEDYSMESRLIYGKFQSERWDYSKHVIPPMSYSTNFRFPTAEEGAAAFGDFAGRASGEHTDSFRFIYDRLDEPNKNLLEEHLAMAEGGDIALVFATGMAAVSATFASLFEKDSEMICHAPVYGCTYDLLARHYRDRRDMEVHFADLTDLSCLDELVNEKTSMIYLESPTNPNLVITDLAALVAKVKELNEGREKPILTVIDNTFGSPFCQRPLEFGVDIVIHSLTKHIGGFGTVMGGAVIAKDNMSKQMGQVMQLRKDFGGSLSPSNAWNILVYGLSTLSLRMQTEQVTALKVAKFLEDHPKVFRVMYPGLESHPQHEIAKRQMKCYRGHFAPGSLIYFLLSGRTAETQKERGMAMANHLAEHAYSLTLAVSLGQIRTLVDHPAGMTHAVIPPEVQAAQGIDPGGVRMSIGIEPAEDIIGDLERALDAVPE